MHRKGMKTTPETRLKRQSVEYLKWKRVFNFPILQGLGAYPGLPDRIAVENGKLIALEFKRPTGRQSENQKKFQVALEAAGGEYIVIRSLEELQKRF